MTMTDRVVRIRLSCDTPATPPGTIIGLQDAAGELAEGTAEPDGSLTFEGQIRVVSLPDGTIRLRGPIVHGPPAAPFLYLSCRPRRPGPAPWLFRLKVPLTGIDPDADIVAGRIRVTGGGSVPLDEGWMRVDR